ncbi:MAG: DUF3365 domain-containing protein [Nitrospirota bacterium]
MERKRWHWGLVALAVGLAVGVPSGRSAEPSKEQTRELVVRYVLSTVHAFRTVYMNYVVEHLAKAGIMPKEDWNKHGHAVMLPFQFVKLAAREVKADLKDLEIGLISLTPIYTSNFPKTQAEVDALKRLAADPRRSVLIFGDGDQVKGVIADVAIQQACADCHNQHPNSTRRDFKMGDLMGAVVVRADK